MATNYLLIKGAGDLASAIALRLHSAGYSFVMTEIEKPSAIRRTVAFADAVYHNSCTVENITAHKADLSNYKEIIAQGDIPILVNLSQEDIERIKPRAVIDAIIAKKNLGTYRNPNYLTIALGPGFTAPDDVDVVIETMRGHSLGRCIYKGSALPNTGIPGEVGGYSDKRVLHAKYDGYINFTKKIGDVVAEGDVMGYIRTQEGDREIIATMSGTIRGTIQENYLGRKGLKISDIDPRCSLEHCYTVSDKGLSLGGAVLEALLHHKISPV